MLGKPLNMYHSAKFFNLKLSAYGTVYAFVNNVRHYFSLKLAFFMKITLGKWRILRKNRNENVIYLIICCISD